MLSLLVDDDDDDDVVIKFVFGSLWILVLKSQSSLNNAGFIRMSVIPPSSSV
jgi:hypothetical protein